ncbi:hypothetical protein [Cellulosimicrobium cellulans]|uniref:hypothetical protein n=1 Tax=Cellulosimicrobium cellulans TaxID=1710 RepID=UPI001BA5C88A|nr:hypothetical protein [Cellulosimicrobium cellulans]QUB99101.1 hypothetical protein J5A69_15445 [Cellulosimicrobium cellulans]
MDDGRAWTWGFRAARPAVELFAIATVLLCVAGALPGLVVAAAVTEYRDEAPRAAAASPELLAEVQQLSAFVGGVGAVLALGCGVLGWRLVRGWARGSSDVEAPRAVATAATLSAAAIVGAIFTAATGSGVAEVCAAGAALLVVTSLVVLGSTQVRAARRAPAG